jgi:oligoribonuclease
MSKQTNLIWLDLEMTGLNPVTDVIIEIATVVTDSHLNVVAEGPVYAINQPEMALSAMDDWNQTQHKQSGLLTRVRASTVTAAMAEQGTLDFLQQHVALGYSPLCGNSICQDRRFLVNYMPQLIAFFHYRNLDVSTLKELAQRWAPDVYAGFSKASNHLALDDVKDSIAECKYYREHFLQLP